MTAQTGAQIIGKALAKAGATHAFGIPGGEVLALMDGLDQAGIRFVLTKHENAAGFMAEGLWHATGAPGVLVATLGPGVANAINTVANAHQDKVPLIFLTGCVDGADAETYTHQIFDHAALLAPVVKASLRAHTGAVGAMIEKAIAIALGGQPGPVHVDVPISVAEAPSPEPIRRASALPAPSAPAPGKLLDAARAALARSRRPLAIAGLDAVNEGAGPAIRAFCKTNEIPLLTTYKAKGLLAETDPLALGGHGLSPKADKLVMPLIAQADCILLLGYDPIEMRAGWRNPWSEAQTVIEISATPRTHGMHAATHALAGSVAASLHVLGGPDDPAANWPERQPDSLRTALSKAFAAREWGPALAFHTLRDACPENTVITADSGAHRILLSQIWTCNAPRQMLQSTALCTMACSVPIAAGFKLGAPKVPVVAVVGDAGLEMGLGELATLRDLKLPVVILVMVDESLGLIELKQRATQRPNLGVDFGGSDFPGVARAMGGHGVWVEDATGLGRELAQAFERGSFTVLACRIGSRAYDGAF